MIDRKHRQMGTQVEMNPWNEIQCCVPVHSKMYSALKSPAVVVAALNMSGQTYMLCYKDWRRFIFTDTQPIAE